MRYNMIIIYFRLPYFHVLNSVLFSTKYFSTLNWHVVLTLSIQLIFSQFRIVQYFMIIDTVSAACRSARPTRLGVHLVTWKYKKFV